MNSTKMGFFIFPGQCAQPPKAMGNMQNIHVSKGYSTTLCILIRYSPFGDYAHSLLNECAISELSHNTWQLVIHISSSLFALPICAYSQQHSVNLHSSCFLSTYGSHKSHYTPRQYFCHSSWNNPRAVVARVTVLQQK